jgi:hypothetical protein
MYKIRNNTTDLKDGRALALVGFEYQELMKDIDYTNVRKTTKVSLTYDNQGTLKEYYINTDFNGGEQVSFSIYDINNPLFKELGEEYAKNT